MRIVLIGQAAFGAKVLETLSETGERVVAVYAPPDRAQGKFDLLKESALLRDIPVFQPKTYKDDGVFDEYKALLPDLTVMAFVTDIIPSRFFTVPPYGTINYHPSILPRHRGASAINWAVIMGDARTGLTIFEPDGGIDTGPVILQKEIPIGPEDTTGSLYFNHLFPMGVEAILETIAMIREGRVQKSVQDESDATYEPPCDDRVAGVDWTRPARDLYNLIRGCDPQPGAYVLVNGEKVRFYSPKLIDEPTGEVPGTITRIDVQGIHVAVEGGKLVVGKVKAGKGAKVGGVEFAAEKGLKVGERLGGLS